MSWPVHYDSFFNKVRGLKPVNGKGDEWGGCCPAHDDNHQSLTIKIGSEGQLMVHCHAGDGCSFDAIVAASGLKSNDFFPPKEAAKQRKMVATYDYRNDEGTLIFQTVRYDPKDFMQRRPNPDYKPDAPEGNDNKKWVYNLQGAQRILYRCQDIAKALTENPNKLVFVVEGEKDADTLWSLGFVATCNPMGAGKWTQEYSDKLAACNIVLIPDEDPIQAASGKRPGLEHAIAVANSLLPRAKSLTVARLPGMNPPEGQKIDTSIWLLLFQAEQEKREAVKDLVKRHHKQDPLVVLGVKEPPPKEEEKPKEEKPKEPPPNTGYNEGMAANLLYVATRIATGAAAQKPMIDSAIKFLTKLSEEGKS